MEGREIELKTSHERFQLVHIMQYKNNVTADYPVFTPAACESQEVSWTLDVVSE
jgi:hypothetical protein